MPQRVEARSPRARRRAKPAFEFEFEAVSFFFLETSFASLLSLSKSSQQKRTQVRELQIAVRSDEQVLRLEVAPGEVPRVQVLDPVFF